MPFVTSQSADIRNSLQDILKVVSKGWILFPSHLRRVQRQASGDTSSLGKHLARSERKKKQRCDLIPQRDKKIIFETQRELTRTSLIFAGCLSIDRQEGAEWGRAAT